MANMDNRRGLHEVRVKKDDLIEKMQANLETHRAEYNEAYLGWVREFDRGIVALEKARASLLGVDECKARLRALNTLVEPKSHEEEYTETLELLFASQDEEFVLDTQTFNQFWRDNWRWKNDFITSNARYK